MDGWPWAASPLLTSRPGTLCPRWLLPAFPLPSPPPPGLGASGSCSSRAVSAGPGGPARGGAPGCTWDLQGTGHTCLHSVLWLLKCRGHRGLNSWGLASARCTYRCGFRLHRAFWEGVGQGAQGLCWSRGPPRTPVRRLVPTGAAPESTFSVRLGSIQGECPVPKPRSERPRRICALEKEREMPVQVRKAPDVGAARVLWTCSLAILSRRWGLESLK